jgi:dTDP-4-amino-4,6-dideoxygalactose transaminase
MCSLTERQKIIPFSPPDISESEIAGVLDILKSGWLTTGRKAKQLERELAAYCHTTKVNCLQSATSAMELCLRLLEVGPGDEVITSAYTYTATASVIHHVGAKIVLVDTEPDSYHISMAAIKRAITDKTKVIMPIDIAGKMVDYDQLFDIIEEKKALFQPKGELQQIFQRIIVLADAAHSFGAKYQGQVSGNVADFTSFSFHAVKNLTTAEGGALTWRTLGPALDEKIYEWINCYSLHGQTKDAFSKTQVGNWEYDIVYPAYKCNMTDIQAAIGLAQLARYPDFLEKRKQLIACYESTIMSDILRVMPHDDACFFSSKHLLLCQVNVSAIARDTLIERLAAKGITTNVHYKPLPMLTAYKNLGFRMEDYPNARAMFEQTITLPLYSQLTLEAARFVGQQINRIGAEASCTVDV